MKGSTHHTCVLAACKMHNFPKCTRLERFMHISMHLSSMACVKQTHKQKKKKNAPHIPTACISPIHSRMHFDANLAVLKKGEKRAICICVIMQYFRFTVLCQQCHLTFGSIILLCMNITQHKTQGKFRDFHSHFKGHRPGGPCHLAEETGHGPLLLWATADAAQQIEPAPFGFFPAGSAQPVFFFFPSFFGLAHKWSSPTLEPWVLSAQKWHGAYKC